MGYVCKHCGELIEFDMDDWFHVAIDSIYCAPWSDNPNMAVPDYGD